MTYEKISPVKKSIIYIIIHKMIYDNESISTMYNHFTIIINSLATIGKVYFSLETIRKILNFLPKRWELKVIAIIEIKDFMKLNINEII